MRAKDWKAAQVRFRTFQFTPSDNIRMAQSNNTMVYEKYYRATKENENLLGLVPWIHI